MLSKKYCSNCYYCEQCGCLEVCDDYVPLTEEAIDEEVNDMIKNDRIAFHAEWFEYIEHCNG